MEKDRPIYTQLIEQIERKIICGYYQPGERLPSVRDLASEAAVNPNTMQRALTELERDGLVYAQRTSGRYITEDQQLILQKRQALAQQEVNTFLDRMKHLGFDEQQTLQFLTQLQSEDETYGHDFTM